MSTVSFSLHHVAVFVFRAVSSLSPFRAVCMQGLRQLSCLSLWVVSFLAYFLRSVVSGYKVFPRAGVLAYISAANHPTLEPHQFGSLGVDHWEGSRSKIPQAFTAILAILLGFTGPIAAQHVDHDVIWLDAVFHQPIQPSEQAVLISAVVPRRVDTFVLHLVIAVVDRRDSFSGFFGEAACVDPLIEADLELAISNLVDSVFPVVFEDLCGVGSASK